MPNIQRIGSASARGFGFGKTGAVYFRGVTETASGVDSVTRVVTNQSVVQETASTADVTSVLVNYINNVVAETASGADAVSSAPVYISTALETASGADSVSTLATNNMSVAETATATDSPSRTGTFNISTSETATGADSTASTRVTSGIISEVTLGYDDVNSAKILGASISETSSGSDSTNSELGVSYYVADYYGSSTSFYYSTLSSTVDDDDNFYIVGYGTTAGVSLGLSVEKYSKNGVLQWQKILDGPEIYDVAYAVAVSASGNVYVAGGYDDNSSSTSASKQRKGLLIKFDASGAKQWDTVFNPTPPTIGDLTSAATRVYSIALDSSENIYSVGVSGRTSPVQMFISKHDSSGALQWFKKLVGSTNSTTGYSIKINSSGNIVIGGRIGTSTSAYPLIAIYDSSGNLLTQTRMVDSSGAGGTRGSIIYSITLDASDNIYATGNINDGVGTGGGCIICKYDSSANLLWAKEYTPSNATSATYPGKGIAIDNLGNIYSIFYTNVNTQIILFKTDSTGVQQWVRYLDYASGNVSFNSRGAQNVLYIDSENNLRLCFDASNSTYTGTVVSAKLPTDGTKTGTYTVGPISITYSTVSFTLYEYTLSWTSQAAAGTQTTPTMVTLSNQMLSYNAPDLSATTYI